jgi:hypothetical protein
VSADDPLARAISDWQRKHHIAEGDPMIAALELVRIYLKQSRAPDNDPAASPPSFEDFRGTIELLDRRSKAFIHQATDLIGELRRCAQNVKRINRDRLAATFALVVLGGLVGALIDRLL